MATLGGFTGMDGKNNTYSMKILACQTDQMAITGVEHELSALSKEECLDTSPLSRLPASLLSSRGFLLK